MPVLLYVAIVFLVSMQPQLAPPRSMPWADKAGHVVEYGILSALLAHALRGTWRGADPTHVALLAMTLGIGIATADELFQISIPGRQASPFDLLADAAGLGIAQLVLRSRP